MEDFPVIKVKVSDIVLAPWNYKTNDKNQSTKLQNAMKRSGYITKITVAHRLEEPGNNQLEVIDGNHRAMAFQDMGVKEIQATYVGRIKKTERMRKGTELNEIRFESDHIKLAGIITEMEKDFWFSDMALTMPYSEDEIKNFGNLLNFDWDNVELKPQTQKQKDESWIDFSFGSMKGKVALPIYEKFVEAIDKLKGMGVNNLTNQIEYLCVELSNANLTEEEAREGQAVS